MSTLRKLTLMDVLLASIAFFAVVGRLFDPVYVGTGFALLHVCTWLVHERVSHTGKWGHAHKAPRHPVNSCD